jgi:hypothetical protein
MTNLPLTAINWLPVVFDWAIAPFAVALIGLASFRESRPIAALGFLIAAGISAALLSLLLATSVFYLFGYGRAVMAMLLNFGPAVTRDYVVGLVHQNALRLLAVLPMIATALSSTVAAIYLRRVTTADASGAGRLFRRRMADQ